MNVLRKFIVVILLALFSFGLIPLASAQANDNISVTIDGIPVVFEDQVPIIVDGRTLVPVRGVFEHLGFSVGWNEAARQVTLTSDNHLVTITIGSSAFTTNGINHNLDVPAQTISGRTMLPIRAVLSSVGIGLDWDGASNTVLIFASYESFERRVFELVNAERAAYGLAALAYNRELAETARRRIENGRFGFGFSRGDLMLSSYVMAANNSPQQLVTRFMDDTISREQILNPNAISFGVGHRTAVSREYVSGVGTVLRQQSSQCGVAMELSLFFATATEIPAAAAPFNIDNMLDAGTWPVSSITLQNRRQTPEERNAWIAEYNLTGPSAFERELLAELNRVRISYNLSEVSWNYDLGRAARFFTQLLVDLDFDRRNAPMGLVHGFGPYGGSRGTAESFGVRNRGASAQWGSRTPAAVIRNLLDSDSHRPFLLSTNITSVGWGTTIGGPGQLGIVHYFMSI